MRGAAVVAALFASAAVVVAMPARGWADSSEDGDSLTLLPWNVASLVVSSKDTRAVVQISGATDKGLTWMGTASVPIEEDSKVATFSSNTELTSGIKLTAKVGWDSDREALVDQAKWLADLEKVVAELQTVPSYALNGSMAAMVRRLGLPDPSEASFWNHLTGSGGLPDRAAVEIYLQSPSLITECQFGGDTGICTFLKDWLEQKRAVFIAYDALTLMLAKRLVDLQIPSNLVAEFNTAQWNGTTRQFVIDNLSALVAHWKQVLESGRTTQLGAALATRPARENWGVVALGEVSGRSEINDVYVDDLVGDPIKTKNYDFAVGADLTVLPPRAGWSFNANAGLERSRANGADKVERCTTPPSEDGTVAGKGCKDVLFREGAQPDADTTGYARIAFTYQPGGQPREDGVLPGLEWRAGFTGLGEDRRFNTRLSLFGTPLKGNTAGRFGLAVDAAYESQWEVTTLVFIGASLADFNKP